MVVSKPLDDGFDGLIRVLIAQSRDLFELANERELREWATSLLTAYLEHGARTDIEEGLNLFRESLTTENPDRRERAEEEPLAYTLLLTEFRVLLARAQRMMRHPYGPFDHSLDVGEVALGSLKDALGGHPAAKAFISLVLELVKLARAIGKRVGSGF